MAGIVMYSNKVYCTSETVGKLKKIKPLKFVRNPKAESRVVNLYPEMKYQKILGFGSAITDAAAFNYGKMSDKIKRQFITACFDSEKGIGLNFCRTHINSCDFSASEYTYVRKNDKELKTFSIAHDMVNIVPLLKAAKKCSDNELKLFASPWSPPAWMKTNKSVYHGGKLARRYYRTWAKYFVKYIQEYQKQGLKMFGLTVQNESMAIQTWESCEYTAQEQALFVRDFLYPELKKAGLSDVRIMVWDHNKERVYDWARDIKKVKGADKCIWGLAFHWYSGEHFEGVRMAHEISPEKHLVMTECCVGVHKSVLASWEDAASYAYDMIGNFNNYMNATVDWNIMLDEAGGPYHARDGACKAPLIYDSRKGKLHLSLIYYAIGHFSKFVKRGAVRLGTSKFSRGIDVVAFENPDRSIVAVILSRLPKTMRVNIRIGDYAAQYDLEANSLTTVVIGS